MNPQMSSVVDVIVDRSPDELIGGVLIALMLALGLTGLFALLRRKVSDVSTLIVCLALVSNLVAMTAAGAFVRYRFTMGRKFQVEPFAAATHFPNHGGLRTTLLAHRFIQEADLNDDGLLSPDEAASAAAQFVKDANEGKEGLLDEEHLRSAIRSRLSTDHFGMGEPPPPPPHHDLAVRRKGQDPEDSGRPKVDLELNRSAAEQNR